MLASQCDLRSWRTASRTDDSERVSTVSIFEASALLSTSDFHRGCVTQTMRAAGNDWRKAATAGNVCTMSPSEPSLTTKKFGSPMWRLAHRFQETPRGVILRVADNRYANAQPRGRCAFRHSFRTVVGALGVHVGTHEFEKRLDVRLAEQDNVIDGAQRSDKTGARWFGQDRPPGSLQCTHAGIGIHRDYKDVSFAPRSFEVPNVSDV